MLISRYWLLDCDSATDVTLVANRLFVRLLDIPFIGKFVVFARAVTSTETRLRIFCVTDDKHDKTLERQQKYREVARSQQVEVRFRFRVISIQWRSHKLCLWGQTRAVETPSGLGSERGVPSPAD